MFIIFIGRVTQFILLMLLMKVATTLLSPQEYGRFALINGLITFFSLIILNPIGMYFNRHLNQWFSKKHLWQGTVFYFTAHFFAATLTLSALLLVTFYFDLGLAMSPLWLLGLVIGMMIFTSLTQTYINGLNILGDTKSFVLLTALVPLFSLSSASFFAHQFGRSAEYWTLGLLVAQVIGTSLVFLWFKNKKLFQKADTSFATPWKSVLAFSWPISLSVGLYWLQFQGYRFVAEPFLGLAVVGMFVAGYGVAAGILSGLESVLSSTFLPELYKKMDEPDERLQAEAWMNYAEQVFPAILVTAVFIFLAAPHFAQLFLGKEFHQAFGFIRWAVIAETFRIFLNSYSLIAHMKLQTRKMIPAHLVGAIVAVAGIVGLVEYLGKNVIGFSLACSGFFALIFIHFHMQKAVKTKIPFTILKPAISGGVVLVAFYFCEKYLLASISLKLPSLAILALFAIPYVWILSKILKIDIIASSRRLLSNRRLNQKIEN